MPRKGTIGRSQSWQSAALSPLLRRLGLVRTNDAKVDSQHAEGVREGIYRHENAIAGLAARQKHTALLPATLLWS
jgi:hypothetical protein